jgi:hypothetical protein
VSRALRAAVIVVMVITLGGCGVGAEGHAVTVDPSKVPFALLDPNAAPFLSPSAPSPDATALCFVDGSELVVVRRSLGSTPDPADVLAALSVAPAGLRTTIGQPPVIRQVGVRGGVATVDLGGEVSTLSPGDQLLAFGQIVCTLTTRPGIGQVSFTLDGAPLNVPRGDGSLGSGPVSRDDYGALLPG